MKIVVTGALGHIGSRLIREFPDAEIVMIDNFLTQRYAALFNLPSDANFRFLEADIMSADLPSLFQNADAVVHLAAITDAAGSFDKSEQVENVNFLGTKRVAEACVRANVPLISLSTTSVYGTQESEVDETCELLQPQSPYAASKLRAEKALAEMGENQGLRFVTLRFGTIFGVSPGMRFHTAVNKFIWQACLGLPLTVWRTALNQKRPYLDLSDGVRALKFVVENGLFDREIYNVVTLNATVGEIVESIRNHAPDLLVNFVDSPIMNQLSYNVSRAKFEKKGFQFQGDLDKGVRETAELLRNIRSGTNY